MSSDDLNSRISVTGEDLNIALNMPVIEVELMEDILTISADEDGDLDAPSPVPGKGKSAHSNGIVTTPNPAKESSSAVTIDELMTKLLDTPDSDEDPEQLTLNYHVESENVEAETEETDLRNQEEGQFVENAKPEGDENEEDAESDVSGGNCALNETSETEVEDEEDDSTTSKTVSANDSKSATPGDPKMSPALADLGNKQENCSTTVVVDVDNGLSAPIGKTCMELCNGKEEKGSRIGSHGQVSEEEDQDEGDEANIPPLITSPASSAGSAHSHMSSKENALPPRPETPSSTISVKKKSKNRRSYTVMTYSPKRKRRHSSGNSKKRGKREMSVSSGVSASLSETSGSTVKIPSSSLTTKKEQENQSGSSSDSDNDSDTANEKEDVYVVERIQGREWIDGQLHYLIKWKGWDESANTWEPIDHLGGCPELVEEFDRKYGDARKSKRRPSAKSSSKHLPVFKIEQEEDEDKMIADTQNFMKSYGIHNEWPAGQVPVSVEGVLHVDQELTYVVKKSVRNGSAQLNRSNTLLVHASSFRERYPQLVIQFYQSRIVWSQNAKSPEEEANIAAQIQLLCQNKGSKISQELQAKFDQEVKDSHPEFEMQPPPLVGAHFEANTELVVESDGGNESGGDNVDVENINVSMEDDWRGFSTPDKSDGQDSKLDKFGLPIDVNSDSSTDVDDEVASSSSSEEEEDDDKAEL